MVKPGLGSGANFVGAIALLAGLVACGGGGGGDSGSGSSAPAAPSTPVAITASNAPAVAAAAIAGVSGVAVSGGLTGVETTAAPVPPRTLGRISVDAAKRAQQARLVPGSVTGATQTFNCAAGGSVTVTDTPNSLTLAFNNCSEYAGEVINGTLSLSNYTETQRGFSAAVSADLTFAQSGHPTIRIVGSYNISVTYPDPNQEDYSATISGSSFSVYEGSNVVTLSNFNFTETYTSSTDLYSVSANYTVAATEIGGSVTVATVSPLQQYGYRMYPFAGQLIATGTGNSKARVTVLGDETHAGNDVTLEVDADGDGTYETTISRDWSAL